MHLRKVPRDLRIYYFWLIPEANSNPWGAWKPPEGTWIINRPRRAVIYIQFERGIIRSFNCAFLLKTCSSEGHLIAAFSLKINVTNRLHTDQGRATWERIYIYAPGVDSKTFSIPNHLSLHRSEDNYLTSRSSAIQSIWKLVLVCSSANLTARC